MEVLRWFVAFIFVVASKSFKLSDHPTKVYLSCKHCIGFGLNPSANPRCKFGCGKYIDIYPSKQPSVEDRKTTRLLGHLINEMTALSRLLSQKVTENNLKAKQLVIFGAVTMTMTCCLSLVVLYLISGRRKLMQKKTTSLRL